METKQTPIALIIMDGWGIREMEYGNAIIQAETPNYDKWKKLYERSILDASGESVGLITNQMGNSEVGHLNLGSGRIIHQEITRIDKSIADRKFHKMPDLLKCMNHVHRNKSKLHLIGLLGPGGVHSHTRHLFAILDVAKQNKIEPLIHIITDGRDTPPKSAKQFVVELEDVLNAKKSGTIASVSGRYFAMDRDNRWERTKLAHDAIASRKGPTATSAVQTINQSYSNNITDEFIPPTIIVSTNDPDMSIDSKDGIIFFNFRADRMRQIVRSFIEVDFDEFERTRYFSDLDVTTFTEYDGDFPGRVLFSPRKITNSLAEVISNAGLSQFHAAETEKYAHVTYFFNGGREEPFEGEDRLLVPSPKVSTYDQHPQMSAIELTEKVLSRISNHSDAFLIINFANPDMVGHTGILNAATKAVEVVDQCVGRIVDAVYKKGGIAIVTADHGNAETTIDPATNEPHTYHTTNPVPLFILSDKYFKLQPRGILADVAPTILDLLGLSQPIEMSGQSLLIN